MSHDSFLIMSFDRLAYLMLSFMIGIHGLLQVSGKVCGRFWDLVRYLVVRTIHKLMGKRNGKIVQLRNVFGHWYMRQERIGTLNYHLSN